MEGLNSKNKNIKGGGSPWVNIPAFEYLINDLRIFWNIHCNWILLELIYGCLTCTLKKN